MEGRRAEVEGKRAKHEHQLARLLGREPELLGRFSTRPGIGLKMNGEAEALDSRMEILARHHRRLDIIEAAMASGDIDAGGRSVRGHGSGGAGKCSERRKECQHSRSSPEKMIGPARHRAGPKG